MISFAAAAAARVDLRRFLDRFVEDEIGSVFDRRISASCQSQLPHNTSTHRELTSEFVTDNSESEPSADSDLTSNPSVLSSEDSLYELSSSQSSARDWK